MNPLPTGTHVVDVDVLGQPGCAEIGERLEMLRPHWLTRGLGYYTLGLATYLDVIGSDDPQQTYFARLSEYNDLIRRNFGDLLDRIADALATLTGEPAHYDERVALPGFHVFEDDGIATSSRPSQHFDLQYREMSWPFEIGPVEQAMSFTLPVVLPRRGGALDVWDITEADMLRLVRQGRNSGELGESLPPRRHEYRVGRMAVQLTPIMHRIAAVPERHPGDQRITLQGHGIRNGEGWVLYW